MYLQKVPTKPRLPPARPRDEWILEMEGYKVRDGGDILMVLGIHALAREARSNHVAV
jgi:hypothetical protein